MIKNKTKKTIIVLGNGASMGSYRYPKRNSWSESISEIPSAKNFFYDCFRIKATHRRDERYINMLGMMYEGVNELVVQAWGMKKNIKRFELREWRDINVEEVLTFFDIGERMYNKGTSYHKAFSYAKKLLIDFIQTMIWTRCFDQHCEYLMDIFSKLQPHDDIISFNWDTIADYTLKITKGNQYKNYLQLMSGNKSSIKQYIKPGVFLKLHGSINWVVCDNKKCNSYKMPRIPLSKNKKEFLDLLSSDFEKCQLCEQTTKRFIVPPISNKYIEKESFLRQLWLITREKLLDTSRIVFIGYSFPVTDFYTEWLFRELNFVNGAQPEIVIVNPEIFKKRSRVFKRYNSIFKHNKLIKYRTLKEYVQEIK